MAVKRKGKQRADGEGAVYPTTRKTTRNGKPVVVEEFRGYILLPDINPRTGQPKRAYFRGKTKPEVASKIRDAINERDKGRLTTTGTITLEAWMRHYFEHVAPASRGTREGARHNTVQNYKGSAERHIYPTLGRKDLKKLTAEDFEAAYRVMVDKGLATSTIRKTHSAVHSALDEAVRRDKIHRNVSTNARIPGGTDGKGEDRELTSTEARAILAVLPGMIGASRYLLALTLALRPGEYLGIEQDRLDLEYGVLRPTLQLQRQRAEHGCGEPTKTTRTMVTREHGCGKPVGVWETTSAAKPASMAGKRPVKPLAAPKPKYPCGQRQVSRCPQVVEKGGQEVKAYPCGEKQPARCPDAHGGGLHLVKVKTKGSAAPMPLVKPVVDAIRADMKEMRRARMLAGDWKGFTDDKGVERHLVYAQANGRPIEPRRDWDDWQAICKLAGVEPINPYASRHTAATMLVELGVHPKVAMGFLRHTRIATTMEIYASRPAEEIRAAADALAAALIASDDIEETGTGQ